MDRKVVITGLGIAAPLGLDVEESWERALNGVSGISPIDPVYGKSPIRAAGQVGPREWDCICREFPAEAETEGERRTMFALWAAKKALSDASLDCRSGDRSRFGISLAAGLGVNRLEDIHNWLGRDGSFDEGIFARECARVHRESIIRNNASRPGALISDRYNFHGINATVSTACASATQALGTAFRAIRRGEADLMLAGGADSMINPVGLIFFVLLGSAAVARMEPEQLCRPFDRKRSGLVMGEGAGIAILEEESHARDRGAHIYAEVAGYASTMDAYRLTAPHPEGGGAEEAMRRALADAGIQPGGIDYINAHGTSTKLNDLAETLAIKRVFGEFAAKIAVSSSKSLLGHLLAASGGPEFVFTTLSVARDVVHPTINLTHRDPKCDLDYVPGEKRSIKIGAALSNSFGFGGQNASIVVRKYAG
ncbi:MAG: beta-ketoacyl-[acyl-carrier-protein] synthase family protein [Syntrophobacter sp.]